MITLAYGGFLQIRQLHCVAARSASNAAEREHQCRALDAGSGRRLCPAAGQPNGHGRGRLHVPPVGSQVPRATCPHACDRIGGQARYDALFI